MLSCDLINIYVDQLNKYTSYQMLVKKDKSNLDNSTRDVVPKEAKHAQLLLRTYVCFGYCEAVTIND